MKKRGKFCIYSMIWMCCNCLVFRLFFSVAAILVEVPSKSVFVAILMDCLPKNVSPLGLASYGFMP